MLKRSPQHARCRGISLIEVMVALIIFSVGLLALAGLQSSSLIDNQVSYLRSQAVLLAGDMADRMRANPQGVRNGAYDSGTPFGGTVNNDCITATGCDPADMAAHDRATWAQALTQLPQGQGLVCVDSTPERPSGPPPFPTPTAPACDGAAVSGMTMRTIKVFWQRNGIQFFFTTQVRINR